MKVSIKIKINFNFMIITATRLKKKTDNLKQHLGRFFLVETRESRRITQNLWKPTKAFIIRYDTVGIYQRSNGAETRIF